MIVRCDTCANMNYHSKADNKKIINLQHVSIVRQFGLIYSSVYSYY